MTTLEWEIGLDDIPSSTQNTTIPMYSTPPSTVSTNDSLIEVLNGEGYLSNAMHRAC